MSTTQNDVAFRRCLVGAVALLIGSVAGESTLGDSFGISSDAEPASKPAIERLVAHVAPDLPLVQVGRWIGRSVLGMGRSTCRS